MKKIKSAAFLILIVFFTFCKNDNSAYSKNLQTALKGLTKLTVSEHFVDSIEQIAQENAQPPFTIYSLEGKPLTREEVNKKQMNITFDCFGDSQGTLKAVVFRDLTEVEFKGKSVTFIGLTFDKEAETKAFLQKTKFDFQVIADAQKIFDQYGIKPCPATIVIDKNGKIISSQIGYEPYQNLSQTKLRKGILAALEK